MTDRPTKPSSRLQEAAKKLPAFRKATIEVTVLALAALFLLEIIPQLFRQSITIGEIAVPESLAERGYTAEVNAHRILDQILEIQAKAGTHKKMETLTSGRESVELTVPGAGVSVGQIARYIKDIFGFPDTLVSGEVTCQVPDCAAGKWSLMLRITGESGVVVLPEIRAGDIQILFRRAAEEILKAVDPYVLAYYLRVIDVPRSRKLIQHILATPPKTDDHWAYLLKGNLLMGEENDPEASIIEYRKALELDPDFFLAHTNWGIALQELNQYQEAIEKYQEAIRHKPDYLLAYIHWGNALQELDQYQEAIEKYQEAVRLQPDDAIAYGNWGVALKELDQYQEAIEKYQEALRHKPDHAFAHYHWGLALERLNRSDEAIEKYRKVIDIDPQGDLANDARQQIERLAAAGEDPG